MIRINSNFTLLAKSYLFTEVARRVSHFKAEHPEGARVISMGIGDVTQPLCSEALRGMINAALDLSQPDTFHGYGPEQGYRFLRDLIVEHDYRARGITHITADEVFVSDGAKSDTGNIGDILSPDARVAVTDPVYPVYVDTNVMAGRAGAIGADGRRSGIEYLPCDASNGFVPALPVTHPDIVYLCYPNNPTGTVLTRQQLKMWVDWAHREGSLILFDSAYEAYVSTPGIPRSIFEIEGAEECAIEFRSYSKTAGFTGVRCGYTVVPKALTGVAADGTQVSLNELWNRRQCTKFNGAGYQAQCAAAAIYSQKGREEVKRGIDYYMRNARMMRQALSEAGLTSVGGIDAPYLWVATPDGISSWEFFDLLLRKCRVVGTPGSGFGPAGEGYLRLTAFGTHADTAEAMERIASLRLK